MSLLQRLRDSASYEACRHGTRGERRRLTAKGIDVGSGWQLGRPSEEPGFGCNPELDREYTYTPFLRQPAGGLFTFDGEHPSADVLSSLNGM